MKDLSDITKAYLSSVRNKQDEIFEAAVRNIAVPTIRGKITKGKIRWRGIKLIVKNDPLKREECLEQRGKRISPIISFTIYTE